MSDRRYYQGKIDALAELTYHVIGTGSWRASIKELQAQSKGELASAPPDPPPFCSVCGRAMDGGPMLSGRTNADDGYLGAEVVVVGEDGRLTPPQPDWRGLALNLFDALNTPLGTGVTAAMAEITRAKGGE